MNVLERSKKARLLEVIQTKMGSFDREGVNMRKIIMFNLVSLDGFFTGSNGEIEWHNVDEEFNITAIEMMKKFDTILFGRITYQLFEGYWPKAALDPDISKEDKIIADKINEITKLVFSKTLKEVSWNNAKLFNNDLVEEVKKLKDKEGKDIVIYGSGTIVQQLTNSRLIDEYRLMVNPVILVNGKSLFEGIKEKINLKLIEAKTFKNGNVLVSYKTTGD